MQQQQSPSTVVRVAAAAICTIALSGCAAPALMLAATAFSVGTTGYSVYKLSSGSTASFEVERSDPDANNLAAIRSARRLVLYPGGNDFDGANVDVLRSKVNMEIVSPTDANRALASGGGLRYAALPSDEKTKFAAQLGQATGADLVLTIEDLGQRSESNVLIFKQAVYFRGKSSLIDSRTARTLWTEIQQVKVDVGGAGGALSPHEVYRVGFQGLADRLMELRTGQKAQQGQTVNTAALPPPANVSPVSTVAPPAAAVGGVVASAKPASVDADASRVLTDRDSIRSIQQALLSRGSYRGGTDGVMGPMTGRAISDYQRAEGIAINGSPTVGLLDRLRSQGSK